VGAFREGGKAIMSMGDKKDHDNHQGVRPPHRPKVKISTRLETCVERGWGKTAVSRKGESNGE